MKLLERLFESETRRREALASGRVMPNPVRCVQCGICSYNCPLGIDVRGHTWRAEPVDDPHRITCGECVARCPRGALQFEQLSY